MLSLVHARIPVVDVAMHANGSHDVTKQPVDLCRMLRAQDGRDIQRHKALSPIYDALAHVQGEGQGRGRARVARHLSVQHGKLSKHSRDGLVNRRLLPHSAVGLPVKRTTAATVRLMVALAFLRFVEMESGHTGRKIRQSVFNAVTHG